MAVAEESEYKGNAMLVLKRSAEDRYPFQFGLSKAKLILESIPAIEAFVKTHGGSEDDIPGVGG